MMSARCAVDAWAMPNSGAAAVPGARDDHYQDNSLDSGVDGMRDSPNNSSDYIPEYILDASSNTTYLSGKFLGKGGFARVHELKDLSANKIFAGKIIPKSRITKPHHRDKIAREIDVHRSLRHRHVVGFHGCFEDDDNVYIVLENCPRQSLVHVLKHRVTLTEPEVRYFMLQLVEGVKFIHSQKIIHRDLKLGNMFLTEDMIMKIGDFGLAARSDTMSSSRVTICGTPNYIAPEVLGKMGHSFQADIWAMGCIMYAMLVGQPPFETSTLKETYCRISRNKYVVPPSLSSPARNLIARLLHPQPSGRPSLDQILSDDFFTNFGRIKVLPTYCCYRRPDFANEALLITRHTEQMDATNNRSEEGYGIVSSMSTLHIDAKPPRSGKVGMKSRREQLMAMDTSNESKLSRSQSLKDNLQRVSKLELGSRQKLVSAESNGKLASSGTTSSASASSVSSAASNSSSSGCHVRAPPQQQPAPPAHNGAVVEPDAVSGNSCNIPLFNHIAVVMLRMQEAVAHCLRVMPVDVRCNPTPIGGSQPLFISKWIDYSNKYGFGFQLSDRSIGVLFNDNTRIACTGNKKRIEFWDNEGGLSIFSHSNVPPQLEERYTLLRYFGKYMDENLTEGGGQGGSRGNKSPECVERVTVNTQGGSSIPHMRRWMRSSTAIIMHLSDGTVQMNFFKDHTKIVIAAAEGDEKHAQKPMILVTYINSQRCCTTYDVTSLALRGCEPLLRERLVYASSVLKDIIPGKEKQV